MKTRRLGKTGYEVSEIGLGCWQLGGDFGPVEDEAANAILSAANQAGINFWDTADVYGGGQSESRIGAFKDKNGVLVATKLGRGPQFEGMARYTKEKVKDSLAGSIKRLGVETLDLAQLHCIPIDLLRDGEIFAWLDDMRDAGMIRHWGASVETIEQALLAMRAELSRPWDSDDLAALTRLSASHVRRLFRRYLRTSPHRWLLRERLTHAQTLIADSAMPMAEIAEACGFCDVYHCSREFKRSIGTPPAAWRRKEMAEGILSRPDPVSD